MWNASIQETLNIDDRACGPNLTFKAGQAATSERVSLLIWCVCPLRTTATTASSRLGSIGHRPCLAHPRRPLDIIGMNTIRSKPQNYTNYTKYSTCTRNTRVTRSAIVEKGGVLQFMRSMKASWRRNPWIERVRYCQFLVSLACKCTYEVSFSAIRCSSC